MNKTLFVFLLTFLALSGCSSLQGQSATQIPCPESQIVIKGVDGSARGWVAACRGVEYYCKQFDDGLRCDEAAQVQREIQFKQAQQYADQQAVTRCNKGVSLSPQNAIERAACWNQSIYALHNAWKYPYMGLLKMELEENNKYTSAYAAGQISRDHYKAAVCRNGDAFGDAIIAAEDRFKRPVSQIHRDPQLAKAVEDAAIAVFRQKVQDNSRAGSTAGCGLYMFDERPQ